MIAVLSLAGGGGGGGGSGTVTSVTGGTANGFQVSTTNPTTTPVVTVAVTGAVPWPDGVRQTFNPDNTTPGLNVGSNATDPSVPSDGDIWYLTGTGFRIRQGSSTRTLATLDGAEALTNKSVNGVTLDSGGSTSLFLNQAGTYTSPGGGGGGSPGGASGNVQLNNGAGGFAGVAGLSADLTTGALTQLQTTLGTTTVPGVTLLNNTAASSGNQQVSPQAVWEGRGWGTTSGTSQQVAMGLHVMPVQATVPTGTMMVQTQIAGGAWTPTFQLTSTGIIQGANGAAAGGIDLSSGSAAIFRWNSNQTFGFANNILGVAPGVLFGFTASGVTNVDAGFTRIGAGSIRLGRTNQASPVSYTLTISESATGTNVNAASATLCGPLGTGTGTGSTLIFQVSVPVASGTGAHTYQTIMSLSEASGISEYGTNTPAGTTGAQTIDKPCGSVNFAAAATTLVVTNKLVTANSLVFCSILTNDSSAVYKCVVPAAGSFTIRLTAAPAAETRVGFEVRNII